MPTTLLSPVATQCPLHSFNGTHCIFLSVCHILPSVHTPLSLQILEIIHVITVALFGWKAQVKGGLHTWTLRWIQVAGLSFVGKGRCIRIFLLCSLVAPRGPAMYTGQEYTARPAGAGRSLVYPVCTVTLTGGRRLGWLEELSCRAPSIGSHSACRSCSPISSRPVCGTLGFGPFSTWGRQKLVRQTRKMTGWGAVSW